MSKRETPKQQKHVKTKVILVKDDRAEIAKKMQERIAKKADKK